MSQVFTPCHRHTFHWGMESLYVINQLINYRLNILLKNINLCFWYITWLSFIWERVKFAISHNFVETNLICWILTNVSCICKLQCSGRIGDIFVIFYYLSTCSLQEFCPNGQNIDNFHYSLSRRLQAFCYGFDAMNSWSTLKIMYSFKRNISCS